jgi:small-conductance mechanosensitive channel
MWAKLFPGVLSAFGSALLLGAIWAHIRFHRLWQLTSHDPAQRRIAAGLARWRGALIVGAVLCWSFATLRLLHGGLFVLLPVVPVVALLAWGARGFVEDVLAGWLVMARVPFSRGDLVEAAGRRGIVVRVGMTALRLRGFDHIEHEIPNWRLLREGLSRLSVDAAEVPVEVDLPWNASVAPIDARALAAICAATSPFASLHARPETFLMVDDRDATRIRVRVRGYVFDPTYAEKYRSHVLEAWLENTSVARPVVPTIR